MDCRVLSSVARVSLILILPVVALAVIPPPPANQHLGALDTRFNNLTEPECRLCHNQNPPDGIPVDPTYLPDRHHLLVGSLIGWPTAAPVPDADLDGVADTAFDCLNCHILIWDGSSYVMDPGFRDCMTCHEQFGGDHHGSSPHHANSLAQADLDNDGVRDTNALGEPVTYCSECHGSLVTDLGDGHFIPTSPPTPMMPWRSGKVNGDSTRVNDRGTEAGNCNFCHDSGIDDDGREVVDGLLSHHGAGFFQGYLGTGPCEWCHYDYPNTSPTIRSEFDIRTCEGCHGFESLHSIQVDSDGDDVIYPGSEMSYYGHIGSNEDCWGCHGHFSTASALNSGPVVPDIHTYTPAVATAGEDTRMTITGVAFTNSIQGPEGPVTLTSDIILETRDGTVTTLYPEVITQSLMEVVIPNFLQAGNYSLRAQKGTQFSSKNVLVVKPSVTITDVNCSKKKRILTVTGTGFGDKPEGTDGYLNIYVNGRTLGIISWGDSQIRASVSTCSAKDSITVDALFGSASNGGKRCRGKKC